MAGVEKRGFDSPDESRTPAKTRPDIVHVGGTTAAPLTLERGWRRSGSVQTVAGTDRCRLRHGAVAQRGQLQVTHDDGTLVAITPGDAYVIDPGHDAEVLGSETFIAV